MSLKAMLRILAGDRRTRMKSLRKKGEEDGEKASRLQVMLTPLEVLLLFCLDCCIWCGAKLHWGTIAAHRVDELPPVEHGGG